mmetsp:Transcript_17389/g.32398  ORF Transcript_17389/g.32398 Transcript_17389/m.32398 type:complete len:222 (+) Transcript_17389:158-823(+)
MRRRRGRTNPEQAQFEGREATREGRDVVVDAAERPVENSTHAFTCVRQMKSPSELHGLSGHLSHCSSVSISSLTLVSGPSRCSRKYVRAALDQVHKKHARHEKSLISTPQVGRSRISLYLLPRPTAVVPRQAGTNVTQQRPLLHRPQGHLDPASLGQTVVWSPPLLHPTSRSVCVGSIVVDTHGAVGGVRVQVGEVREIQEYRAGDQLLLRQYGIDVVVRW